MQRLAITLILVLAFFGLADSAYLAQSVASGEPLLCDFRLLSGCEAVAKSPYSKVLGVPLADFGIVFFALLFILAALELAYSHHYVRRAIQACAAFGLIASAYFIFVQFSIIQAFCIYCVFSAIVTACIFGLAYFIEPLGGERRSNSVSLRPRFALPQKQ